MEHHHETSSLPTTRMVITTTNNMTTVKPILHTQSLILPATTHPPPQATKRRRPAFEKLLIGPLMCFGEDVTGGHYLEVLRLGKQMSVGSTPPSYLQLHVNMVSESSRGVIGAVYRGFFPWGMLQSVKGVPVLFVQNESRYQLEKYKLCPPSVVEHVAGFFGGASQALFVCPLQKLKVTVVASSTLNQMHPLHACFSVVQQSGFLSLFDGLFPMMLRRSIDWGIRFGACAEIKKLLLAQKETREHKRSLGSRKNTSPSPSSKPSCNQQLTTAEALFCAFMGGACSALTHPIDNVITNAQKPLPLGADRGILAVVQRMHAESGMHAFTRGWIMRILDNSYHMVWMYGIGNILYDHLQTNLLLRTPVY